MSRPDSEPSKVSYFKGTGWQELETFIHEMRGVGWKEGKLQDQLWMANYASLHFSGKALRWHAELPQDVQDSWRKLEVAMIAHWAPPDGLGDDDRVPAAAAASSTTLGVIKVIFKQSNDEKSLYLRGPDGVRTDCHLTPDFATALRVRHAPRSRPYDLELVNNEDGQGYGWLAMHWNQTSPNLNQSSPDWARITVIDSASWESSCRFEGPFETAGWRGVTNGEVSPTWINGRILNQLVGFVESGSYVTLTLNEAAYNKRYPHETKCVK